MRVSAIQEGEQELLKTSDGVNGLFEKTVEGAGGAPRVLAVCGRHSFICLPQHAVIAPPCAYLSWRSLGHCRRAGLVPARPHVWLLPSEGLWHLQARLVRLHNCLYTGAALRRQLGAGIRSWEESRRPDIFGLRCSA